MSMYNLPLEHTLSACIPFFENIHKNKMLKKGGVCRSDQGHLGLIYFFILGWSFFTSEIAQQTVIATCQQLPIPQLGQCVSSGDINIVFTCYNGLVFKPNHASQSFFSYQYQRWAGPLAHGQLYFPVTETCGVTESSRPLFSPGAHPYVACQCASVPVTLLRSNQGHRTSCWSLVLTELHDICASGCVNAVAQRLCPRRWWQTCLSG